MQSFSVFVYLNKKIINYEKTIKISFVDFGWNICFTFTKSFELFYSGYGYRNRYYSRPSYGYLMYQRPQVRVYVALPRRYFYNNYSHRNRIYGYQNRTYRDGENHEEGRGHISI
jgi:hypothetical protein